MARGRTRIVSALCLLAASTAGLLLSPYHWGWAHLGPLELTFYPGELQASWIPTGQDVLVHFGAFYPEAWNPGRVWWFTPFPGEPGARSADLGLAQAIWYPPGRSARWDARFATAPVTLLPTLPAALLLRSGLRAFARARPGACPGCGYPRAGLNPSGRCPECGRDPPTARSTPESPPHPP